MFRSSLFIAAVCAALLGCAGGSPAKPADRSPKPLETRAIATATAAPSPPDPCALGAPGPDGLTPLARGLRAAVEQARFDEVLDLGPSEDPSCPLGPRCVTAPIARRPSVDVAVIAFAPGCPPAYANAMTSASAPGVHLADIDPSSLAVRSVRYRAWDQDRWDSADPTLDPAPGEEGAAFIIPPPEGARFTFDVPYPASNFKVLVAVTVLSLVDRGALRLEEEIPFEKRSRPLSEWLTQMITASDDESTQALIKMLHEKKRIGEINALFARLGLTTLQMHDTSPRTGRNWHPGKFHMSAWDTARLLWLLDDAAPAPTWRAPRGGLVNKAPLRPASRALLLDLLGAQAFHDALSTTALCGVPGAARGIPALYPARWIDAAGHARIESGARAGDIRVCNAGAEVSFAHKTGLTLNFGSDAGIVRGLSGKARRHYIVTFFSNLGYRYTDADRAAGPNPCRELGVCYTRKIGALGAAMDALVAGAVER